MAAARTAKATPLESLTSPLPRPVPVPGCAECARLAAAEQAAGRDRSAAADQRIYLRRHLQAEHH